MFRDYEKNAFPPVHILFFNATCDLYLCNLGLQLFIVFALRLFDVIDQVQIMFEIIQESYPVRDYQFVHAAQRLRFRFVVLTRKRRRTRDLEFLLRTNFSIYFHESKKYPTPTSANWPNFISILSIRNSCTHRGDDNSKHDGCEFTHCFSFTYCFEVNLCSIWDRSVFIRQEYVWNPWILPRAHWKKLTAK